jgi:hypothetical protein
MTLTDEHLKEFGKTLTAEEWVAVERHCAGRASVLSWEVIKRFRWWLKRKARSRPPAGKLPVMSIFEL